MSYIFNVPSGIGDISWIYSKLVNFPYPFQLKIVKDEPQRSLPFTRLLPRVINSAYSNYSYVGDFVKAKRILPSNTDLPSLDPGEYFLSANPHLEQGNRIETYLPTLPTSFHYDIKDEPIDLGLQGKLIGIYPSKYQTYGWHFWEVKEWVEFMTLVRDFLGGCSFVVIGAGFDKGLGDDLAKEEGLIIKSFVGKTFCGQLVNLIKQLDFLVAYPSGVGVLGGVLSVPTLHFIPPQPWIEKMRGSYADPKDIISKRHVNLLFTTPEVAFETFKEMYLNQTPELPNAA
jgi:hypothetical protein